MWINWEEQQGNKTDHTTQGSSMGKKTFKTSGWKNLWELAVVGEIPSLTGEFFGETYRVLDHTQTHPPGNQHQKGPTLLVSSGGSD